MDYATSPRLVQGSINNKFLIHASAGFEHTGCVTLDGKLYTFGNGQAGRLSRARHIHVYQDNLETAIVEDAQKVEKIFGERPQDFIELDAIVIYRNLLRCQIQ